MTDKLPLRAHPRGDRPHDTGNFKQRLKAAGLDGDDLPDDIDEFRMRFARTIMMFINQWQGCRERLCRRHQGCMAPNGGCANLPKPTAEESERDWPKAKVAIRKALDARLAALGEGWD
jgi:hypothetical protein